MKNHKPCFFIIAMILWCSVCHNAYACAACVDEAVFFFYPFLKFWLLLVFLWLMGRQIFRVIATSKKIPFPASLLNKPIISLVYWLFLFYLSLMAPRGGGLVFLLGFIILPSWIISYTASFIKIRRLESKTRIHKNFIIFQITILLFFILMVPVSYLIPRKKPHNVRMVDADRIRPATQEVNK